MFGEIYRASDRAGGSFFRAHSNEIERRYLQSGAHRELDELAAKSMRWILALVRRA
jgi:hypothetical protein